MIERKVLIISFSDIKNDPRVYRQILFLKDSYKITSLGFSNSNIESVRSIVLNKVNNTGVLHKIERAILLLSRNYESAYWKHKLIKEAIEKIKENSSNFDIVIANDFDTLPLASWVKNNGFAKKLLFDAHEYSPLQFEDRLIWRIFFMGYAKYLIKKYIRQADKMVTVSYNIADRYKKENNIECDVITNAGFYHELLPSTISDQKIRIIHHGNANRSRNIELMMDMADFLDSRFEMYFMLMPVDKRYYNFLIKYAKNKENVHIIEPVKMNEIVSTINKYDIGLFLLKPVNYNYANALPNKLFEFIQARLAIAIGPTPEMVNIVKKYDLGVIADSFNPKDLAYNINNLTKEMIWHFKNQTNIAAKELTAEKNKALLMNIIDDMI